VGEGRTSTTTINMHRFCLLFSIALTTPFLGDCEITSSFDNCNLCYDGSTPQNTTFGFDVEQSFSCLDYTVVQEGSFTEIGFNNPFQGVGCDYLFIIGHLFCGCPEPPGLSTGLDECPFCYDSASVPSNFDPRASSWGATDGPYQNCGAYLAEVVTRPGPTDDLFYCHIAPASDEPKRHFYQAHEFCGCANPAPPGCTQCSDGSSVVPGRMFTLVAFDGTSRTCESLTNYPVNASICPGGKYVEGLGDSCCEPGCTQCPSNGGYPVPPDLETEQYVIFGDLSRSCSQMAHEPIYPDICPDGTWRPDNAATCCGNCSICVDGSAPNTDAFVYDPMAGGASEFPCETYIGDTLRQDPQTYGGKSCDFFHMMGYFYCGCPAPDDVSTMFKSCPFCYNSTGLPDSALFNQSVVAQESGDSMITCGYLAAEVASSPNDIPSTCGSPSEYVARLELAHDKCGCDKLPPQYECQSCPENLLQQDPMYEINGIQYRCDQLIAHPVNDEVCPAGDLSSNVEDACCSESSSAESLFEWGYGLIISTLLVACMVGA